VQGKKFTDQLLLHIRRNYLGKGGLKRFCRVHGLSYNSVRKVYRGSKEYPGVEARIRESMVADETCEGSRDVE